MDYISQMCELETYLSARQPNPIIPFERAKNVHFHPHLREVARPGLYAHDNESPRLRYIELEENSFLQFGEHTFSKVTVEVLHKLYGWFRFSVFEPKIPNDMRNLSFFEAVQENGIVDASSVYTNLFERVVPIETLAYERDKRANVLDDDVIEDIAIVYTHGGNFPWEAYLGDPENEDQEQICIGEMQGLVDRFEQLSREAGRHYNRLILPQCNLFRRDVTSKTMKLNWVHGVNSGRGHEARSLMNSYQFDPETGEKQLLNKISGIFEVAPH